MSSSFFYFAYTILYHCRINGANSSVQCTYDPQRVSLKWQRYFEDLSFGLNYHTIRCLLSELIPSLLVALFNIAIIACILRTTAHVRRQQLCNPSMNNSTVAAMTGSTTKIPQTSPVYVFDRSHQLQCPSSVRTQISLKGPAPSSNANVPFGKMSWMNVVLLLHSLLFFLSSSVASLVFFSTSDMILASWVSVIILANCSLNFYIYCVSGRQFRKELKRIAKIYIRHIRKIFVRNRYSPSHRRSPVQNIQNNIQQPVQHANKHNNLV